MGKSLKLVNKDKKKDFFINTPYKQKKSKAPKASPLIYADGDDNVYGGIFSDWWSGISDTNFGNGEELEDAALEVDLYTYITEKEDAEVYINKQNYISSMILTLTDGKPFVTLDVSTGIIQNPLVYDTTEMSPIEQAQYAVAFDPRLQRVDAFLSENKILVPFASDTASSAFFDQLFTIESAVIDEATKEKSNGYNGNEISSGSQYKTDESKALSNGKLRAADKIPTNTSEYNTLKADPNSYGVNSLVNPYCVTRLCGGLSGNPNSGFSTHMYDIRDVKRFYDNNNDGTNPGGIVAKAEDFTSINNPTTTNIITWSNKDSWGRTPYSFQDFVFCKYWNIIPNNRLITFRKYGVPTYDNLCFPNMLDKSGEQIRNDVTAAPIATVVTYFGGDSGNKLNDFLKFTTGTKWKDINAEIHKISGEMGENPRATIDSMFENGGFGGQGSRSSIINAFLGKSGGLTGQYLSFGKFLGLLDPDGYKGHSQKAWNNLSQKYMDPSESLYENKIKGPVNRVQSVKARDAGIEFNQSFNLTCEYVARPIGGINTKAAMLDILSNCMEIASPEASFWGGGYRFMIKPSLYPFKRDNDTNTMMEDLYAGRIFGINGAIAHGLEGLLKFGSNGGQTSFDWGNVTAALGNVLSQTVGAIGNMINSIGSALFGSESTVGSWIKKAGDTLEGVDESGEGKKKLNNMFENINKMWKDKVIQETTMPNIQGMKAILTGEPTGNWHLTLGNPLNPIMVVGNLICTKMEVQFDEELGPDDFPISMKVVYTIEHAMARDKAAIQSMFNRGAGKIYKLPDYIKASSDYESKVDDFTGLSTKWYTPDFKSNMALLGELQNQSALQGAHTGGGPLSNGTYNTFKVAKEKQLPTTGNSATTLLSKFTPIDPDNAMMLPGSTAQYFRANTSTRAVYRPNSFTQKQMN